MNDAMTAGHLRRVVERPRYYARQLITPAELNLEAAYFVDRLRRHNRLLHGWGVICGALVCRVPNPDGTGAQPWKVKVAPGHLIDPYGNEIAILVERIVDLRADDVSFTPDDAAGELSDPWCSDVWTEREGGTLWVGVRYHEAMARPVRVQPAGCSCDDASCEYSRWCDGYKIGVLDHCPESHQAEPPSLDDLLGGDGGLPSCPPDPTDPWVVLAAVDVDDDGKITTIDNCSCRRMVASLASLWWRCEISQLTVTGVTVTPSGPYTPNQTDVVLTVNGTNIEQGATADLGQGVKVTAKEVKADGSFMKVTIRILKSAQPGERTLTVTNPDCTIASAANALTVTPPTAAPPRATRRRS
jgi:hypothetical protein